MTDRAPMGGPWFGWPGGVEGPLSWDELDLDLLDHAPPRGDRCLYDADGDPYRGPEGLVVWANGSDLHAYEQKAIAGRPLVTTPARRSSNRPA